MSDPTRSFLDLLAVAGVTPRLLEGDRLAARLDHLPPQQADDCRTILRTHGSAIVAELRARDPQSLPQEQARRSFRGAGTARTSRPSVTGPDRLAAALRGPA